MSMTDRELLDRCAALRQGDMWLAGMKWLYTMMEPVGGVYDVWLGVDV